MRRRLLTCPFVILLILLSTQPSAAADKAEATPSPGDRAKGDAMSRVLSDVSFQDVGFDDVIDYLRDASGFQAVIVRDPGVPDGEPVIRLKLKSVPVGQLLQVIQTAHPEIGFEPVEHPNGPVIQVIRIHATEENEAAGKAGPKVVRVYPLSNEILSVLRTRGELGPMGAPEKEVAQKGLEHVLSLIKNVVEAAGERTGASLAVHEETQSLIVTGTAEQQGHVQEALAALRGEHPKEQQDSTARQVEAHWRERKAADDEQIQRLQRETDRLKAELDETRQETRKAQDEARQQAIEAERIRVRLEDAMSRGTAPATKAQERPTDSEKGTSSTPGSK